MLRCCVAVMLRHTDGTWYKWYIYNFEMMMKELDTILTPVNPARPSLNRFIAPSTHCFFQGTLSESDDFSALMFDLCSKNSFIS